MFSVGKNQLVRNLCKLAAHSCAYSRQPCDCKFIPDAGEPAPHSELGSGCPELTVAAMLISQLSGAQFEELAKQAGIIVNEDGVNVISTIKEFQDKRFAKGDFLDELITESTAKNPNFPKLLKKAENKRKQNSIVKKG